MSNQKNEIAKWESEDPSVVSRFGGTITAPLTWTINKIVPEGALELAYSAAGALTTSDHLLKTAGVISLAELCDVNLRICDDLANEAHNWALGIATVEGGLTGTIGLFGLAADMPALIVLSVRTIKQIGLCNGFESNTEEEDQFVKLVLLSAGANSMKEKAEAFFALHTIQTVVMNQTWKKMAETAATNNVSKEDAVRLIRNLARQLGVNLTKRKVVQAIPFIGAGVGAALNAQYINDVAWAARRMYQKRAIDHREDRDIK